jgi:hypothetical protein
MERTLLSCLHSSRKPPNKMVYSAKGQFHHEYEIYIHGVLIWYRKNWPGYLDI